ncbi:hypothetical protein Tco_0809289 [Tanacetum coccineum]
MKAKSWQTLFRTIHSDSTLLLLHSCHGSTWGSSGILCKKIDQNIGMDKSKITRKQSKASKHGHENQKSSKRSQRSKALANFHPQGPFLQFPKVIYNLKERKERQGPNVQPSKLQQF